MESQTIPPTSHGHVYEEGPPKPIGLHSVVVEDEEEHHHEKQSVLKKVKAKARKLKDTITKHGHSHDEHHAPDDHDLDEEEDDDEDEEMLHDPEVHGAPMYDSATVPAAVGFAHSAHRKAPGDGEQLFDPRRHENLHHMHRGNMEQLRNEGGGLTPMNTPAAAPLTTQLPQDPTRVLVHGNNGAPRVNLTRPHGLEEDPAGPTNRSRKPPNYETKVTGPINSSGNEAKIEPLSSSFGEMKIGDRGEAKTSHQVNESHDRVSPGSYTETITSATAAVADKAVAAKNLVASKLGYGSTEGERPPPQEGGGGGGYTEKISSAGHVIADTAASAKNIVASTLGYGGEGDYSALKPKSRAGPTGQDKGVSVREYWVEKLRPGEEDKALSEVISSALHTGKNKKEDTSPARPVGVVTETEEVRRYLGESGKEGQLSSPGKKVVETLKGTVESWFGKSGDQSTNQTQSHHHGEKEHVGERRLKESSQ